MSDTRQRVRRWRPCRWWAPWRHRWGFTRNYGTIECERCHKQEFVL